MSKNIKEIEFTQCDVGFTLHELVEDLTRYLNLNPEQQFRVTAKIKRLIHREKQDVYFRCALYGDGIPVFDRSDPNDIKLVGHEDPADPFLVDHLTKKAESHKHLATLPDEEIVTWDVGTHKFKQE